jgi:hypothetical protein
MVFATIPERKADVNDEMLQELRLLNLIIGLKIPENFVIHPFASIYEVKSSVINTIKINFERGIMIFDLRKIRFLP